MDQVASLSHMIRTVVQEPQVLAAGLWRCGFRQLTQECFVASEELPVQIAREFSQATRMVSLTRTNLGIVAAAVSSRIILVEQTMTGTSLNGSAGWLQRFGAKSSCSIPVFAAGSGVRQPVCWVVAVATRQELTLDSEVVKRWARTTQGRSDNPVLHER